MDRIFETAYYDALACGMSDADATAHATARVRAAEARKRFQISVQRLRAQA